MVVPPPAWTPEDTECGNAYRALNNNEISTNYVTLATDNKCSNHTFTGATDSLKCYSFYQKAGGTIQGCQRNSTAGGACEVSPTVDCYSNGPSFRKINKPINYFVNTKNNSGGTLDHPIRVSKTDGPFNTKVKDYLKSIKITWDGSVCENTTSC